MQAFPVLNELLNSVINFAVYKNIRSSMHLFANKRMLTTDSSFSHLAIKIIRYQFKKSMNGHKKHISFCVPIKMNKKSVVFLW